MTSTGTHHLIPLRVLFIAAACVFCAPLHAEDAAADKVRSTLQGDFYEIEFFVFERNPIMEFNTREVLVHATPESYPASMLALRSADEAFGSSYQIDLNTRLCLTYPSLVYSSSDTYGSESENADTGGGQPESATTAAVNSGTSTPEALLPAQPIPEPEPIVDPARELQEAIATFEEQLYASSNSWMSPDTFTLSREASQIARRANARVLFHGRWLQPLQPRNDPLPVFILAGDAVADGHELTGSVGVTLGRYLHFQAELNYTAPALGEYPAEVATTEAGGMVVVPTVLSAGGFMTMAQSRRMRSGELHYLDHPKLGILVRIDPVTIPQSLLDLALALEEGQQ